MKNEMPNIDISEFNSTVYKFGTIREPTRIRSVLSGLKCCHITKFHCKLVYHYS